MTGVVLVSRHSLYWTHNMGISMILALAAGVLSADPPKEPPAKADILAGNERYAKEPGRAVEYVGVLRKAEGRYYIELRVGKEELRLYSDAGDPLAPYVGKRVTIFGKQFSGNARFTWPGRLEVLPSDKKDPEAADIPDRTRQEDDLERIREEIRKAQEERQRKEADKKAPDAPSK